jgi:hypothetical protein
MQRRRRRTSQQSLGGTETQEPLQLQKKHNVRVVDNNGDLRSEYGRALTSAGYTSHICETVREFEDARYMKNDINILDWELISRRGSEVDGSYCAGSQLRSGLDCLLYLDNKPQAGTVVLSSFGDMIATEHLATLRAYVGGPLWVAQKPRDPLQSGTDLVRIVGDIETAIEKGDYSGAVNRKTLEELNVIQRKEAEEAAKKARAAAYLTDATTPKPKK